MFKFKIRIKKIVAMSAASFIASLTMISSANAESLTERYLAYITQFTFQTAQATYYISYNTLAILNSFILPDSSDPTANLQSGFVTNTNTLIKNEEKQNSLQTPLMKTFLRGKAQNLDYVNDVTYQTLLGQPFAKKDSAADKNKNVNAPLNYLKNVAGLNINHQIPTKVGKGTDQDKENYQTFYTTISAIQSYDAYILSELYLNNAGKEPLSKQQNALMQQASNSGWFAQVASESIGSVVRQILIYNSQTFVLLTELLQTQKQLLATQAMTNTLLVLGNQFTENQLLSRATGIVQ